MGSDKELPCLVHGYFVCRFRVELIDEVQDCSGEDCLLPGSWEKTAMMAARSPFFSYLG